MRARIVAVAGVAWLACTACGSGSTSPPAHGDGSPASSTTSFSSAGDMQCAVRYHGSGTKTAVTISVTVAGKLDVSSAAVRNAEEQTRTMTAPGSINLDVNGNPLESLTVTLKSATASYTCSVTPY